MLTTTWYLQLQAPVYGLAEQAAKIIRATYNGVGWPSDNQSGGDPSKTSTGAPSPTGSPQNDRNAAAGVPRSIAGVVAAVAVLASLLL